MKIEECNVRADLSDRPKVNDTQIQPTRREFLAGIAGTAFLAGLSDKGAIAQADDHSVNIARVASPTGSTLSSENNISALNDGFIPSDSFDRSHDLYALHKLRTGQAERPWVQYDWSHPVLIDRVDVYWAVDHPRSGELPGAAWPTLLNRLPFPPLGNGLGVDPVLFSQPAPGSLDYVVSLDALPLSFGRCREVLVPQSLLGRQLVITLHQHTVGLNT